MEEAGGRPPGWPGIAPRWTRGDKQAVGTAAGGGSRVWFTVSQGVLSEVYFPSPDRAHLRDLQLLVTGPEGLFLEQRRHFAVRMRPREGDVPVTQLDLTDPEGRLDLSLRVFTAPHADAVWLSYGVTVRAGRPEDYRLFVLMAPHVGNQGYGNCGRVGEAHGRPALFAWREDVHLCLMGEPALDGGTVTYAGPEDAYWDIRSTGHLSRRYPAAEDGNLALAAEIPWRPEVPVRLVLGFGRTAAEAAFEAHRSLVAGEEASLRAYVAGWRPHLAGLDRLVAASGDGGCLLRHSVVVLHAHRDKRTAGAAIASLSIPWGYACGDQNVGGYHLIWTRDLYEAATALLALDQVRQARDTLLYIASIQRGDGGWPQNSWLDGTPYWSGVQLDETAFPVLLAFRLEEAQALDGFDPWPMVRRALAYLLGHGPETQQDRWEEDAGYSPSTVAAELAALVCGAVMARRRGEEALAGFLEETADEWLERLDRYAVAVGGELDPEHPYYVRIAPLVQGDAVGGDTRRGYVPIRNLAPDQPHDYPVGAIVDGGFLELVRYGVKPPDDPVIRASVALVDRLLKVHTPKGDLWHRYNHDGYGEHADGSAYDGTGIGRAWPLLTGERGHYELARGGTGQEELRTLEAVAGATGLLPEQVWDAPDLPERRLFFGEATGSARPLVWAHAEYVKLLRSRADGRVFDRLEPVVRHFAERPRRPAPPRVWAFNHKLHRLEQGRRLRLWLLAAATVRLTRDGWATWEDRCTQAAGLGVHLLDLPSESWPAGTLLQFTFHWTEADRWEGVNFAVEVTEPPAA